MRHHRGGLGHRLDARAAAGEEDPCTEDRDDRGDEGDRDDESDGDRHRHRGAEHAVERRFRHDEAQRARGHGDARGDDDRGVRRHGRGDRLVPVVSAPTDGGRQARDVEDRVVGDHPEQQGDEHRLQLRGRAETEDVGQGRDQVVMGWRNPNVTGETGVRIFVGSDPEGKKWQEYALDDKIKIACEDITAADLDGDGDLDILASGRSTHNVVVYWTQKKK